ncbi:hypothetical protein ACR52_17115 [Pseudomonas fildesensis]|uniref:Uncharacterized protein n=1 Tax=Pseudomonas fildesensis TaxID=1674920 RepID=A0A0J8G0L8_9PSED|nr:hypothetical protein ACR52_17115 [Pseudomonas fildesensis]
MRQAGASMGAVDIALDRGSNSGSTMGARRFEAFFLGMARFLAAVRGWLTCIKRRKFLFAYCQN